MHHRLFIGLRPPHAIRAALLGEMHGIERVRWQNDGQLHLTLRYVGELDRRLAQDLAQQLGGIRASSFTLQVQGTGVFEKKGQVHTLWAGFAASPELDRFQRKVERTCQAVGIIEESCQFVPHITLARVNGGSGSPIPFLQRTAGLQLEEWEVEDFILFESHLRPEGSLYEPVHRFPLDSVS